MQTIAVIGAGTMGHGIAQVCAMAGCTVRLADAKPQVLELALGRVRANLDKGVDKGKVTPEERDAALLGLTTVPSIARAAQGAELVIEAVPEVLSLKRSILAEAAAVAPAAVLASNTSSLSIDALAEGLPRPDRFLGMHFFNPVHLMPLLELVRGSETHDDVLSAAQELGARIGKEVIVVRDTPGFATSRLGVALGMEAIRMVEQGVASPQDIDKAMVLGYRHPVGPLRLGDMVGLDVRMAIGEYLASELGNPAFEPPVLLREMVAEGKLGRKSGEGFYRW